jgi:hypothetical protein
MKAIIALVSILLLLAGCSEMGQNRRNLREIETSDTMPYLEVWCEGDSQVWLTSKGGIWIIPAAPECLK